MDPVTAIAIASTAFNTIKKGIEVGKDLESMSGDLSRWMGAIGNIKEAEKKAKNPSLFKSILNPGSVEQEAIDAFAAKKKVEAMENDLRTFVNFNYGPNSWNEILRMQAQIRKQRLNAQKEKEKFAENVFIVFLYILILALVLLIASFVIINI